MSKTSNSSPFSRSPIFSHPIPINRVIHPLHPSKKPPAPIFSHPIKMKRHPKIRVSNKNPRVPYGLPLKKSSESVKIRRHLAANNGAIRGTVFLCVYPVSVLAALV
jgi:hypothetical protein